MKLHNEYLYKSIISYLPTKVKDKLRDLLASDNVGTDQEGGSRTRRILKVGGVKSDLGYQEQNQEENTRSGSKKRNLVDHDADDEGEVQEPEGL